MLMRGCLWCESWGFDGVFVWIVKESELGQKKPEEKDAAAAAQMIPFFHLFRFASPTDKLYMVVGTLFSMGNGCSLPLFSVVFGKKPRCSCLGA